MKRKISAILLAIFLIIGVLGAFCGCTNNGDGNTDAVPTESTQDEATLSLASPDETGAIISQIKGFSKKTVAGDLSFPYEIENKSITVTAIGAYTGEYVEDGSDEAVQDVMALVVQNTSDKPIQYATVTVKDSGENAYTFVISTLPQGTSALVLESEKKTLTDDTEISEITATVTESDGFSSHSDKVSIMFEDGKLKLKNLTDTDFRAVYVRYKNYTEGNVYMGGITYNASFETVAAGNSYEYEPGHFFEDRSLILMVEVVE